MIKIIKMIKIISGLNIEFIPAIHIMINQKRPLIYHNILIS